MAETSKRYPDRTRIALIALLILATYYLFAGGSENEYVPRSIRELWNLGHIAYFALLVYLLRCLQPIADISWPAQWILLILLTLVLGVVTEISQMGTLREPDWMDVSRDLMGCLLVLVFSPVKRRTGALWPDLVRYAVGLLLLVHLVPLGVAVMDESFARKQFPVLSNFETPFELDRWNGNSQRGIVELDAASGERQMRIDLTTDLYSSVSLIHLRGDWRGFESISMKILQPDEGYLPVSVRIHDQAHEQGPFAFAHHDRFNRRFMLAQGWNELVIPLYAVQAAPKQRDMDLARIRNLMLFTTRLAKPRTLYLESVFLSRQ